MNRKRWLFIFSFLALLSIFMNFHFSARMELHQYDFFLRSVKKTPLFPGLVLVEINQNSITSKRPWPFAPKLYTDFLSKVEKGKPKAVTFDLDLEASPQISKRDFEFFLKQMKGFGNVLFSLPLSPSGEIQRLSPELEKSVPGFGVSSVYQDPDSVVRRVPLLSPYHGTLLPSLPLLAAGAYLDYLQKAKPVFQKDGKFDWFLPQESRYASEYFSPLVPLNDRPDVLLWVGMTIPKASGKPDLLINYAIDFKNTVIPFWKILDNKIPSKFFKDKLILVYLSSDISDSYVTPMSHGFLAKDKIPGGEILGCAIHTILSRSSITRASEFLEDILAVVLFGIFLFGLSYFGIFKGAYFFLVPLLYWTLSFYLFKQYKIWLGTQKLFLASFLLYAGALIADSQRFVETIFKLLPSKMAQGVERGRLRVEIGGKPVKGTALFVDMSGYTAFTEKSPLEETFKMLQEFHQSIERLVKSLGGIICDWQGDGVLVFFSKDPETPSPVISPYNNAVKAALQMKEHFLSKERQIGIGIASGQVLWGFLGTSAKAQPTCIGDPVNLASRLQGIGKESGAVIAVDEGTYLAAKESFIWEELGTRVIKGKQEAIRVYSPKAGKSKEEREP